MSRRYFGTDGVRGRVGEHPMTVDFALQLASAADRHVRFLRKIPIDPMTGNTNWGMRSVQDDADSGSWGGQDVFDVYSRSTATALDGTRYSDW